MTDPAELVARWLRQRPELGGAELVLDDLPARELIEALRAASGRAPDPEPARAPEPPRAPERAPASPRPSRSAVPPASTPPEPAPPPEPLTPVERAAGAPAPGASAAEIVQIGDLDALREIALGCPRCRLAETRNMVVFGEGSPTAHVVVVGEAPGAEEDRTGRPFVGRAGKLLDLLLATAGFGRESVFICNVLKCRPPGNRNPALEEIEACSPYLVRQLELIRPRAIFAVGTFAAQTLLATTTPIGSLRGTDQSYREIPLVPTYHPAALLRNPAWVRPVWEDLQRLRSIVDSR